MEHDEAWRQPAGAIAAICYRSRHIQGARQRDGSGAAAVAAAHAAAAGAAAAVAGRGGGSWQAVAATGPCTHGCCCCAPAMRAAGCCCDGCGLAAAASRQLFWERRVVVALPLGCRGRHSGCHRGGAAPPAAVAHVAVVGVNREAGDIAGARLAAAATGHGGGSGRAVQFPLHTARACDCYLPGWRCGGAAAAPGLSREDCQMVRGTEAALGILIGIHRLLPTHVRPAAGLLAAGSWALLQPEGCRVLATLGDPVLFKSIVNTSSRFRALQACQTAGAGWHRQLSAGTICQERRPPAFNCDRSIHQKHSCCRVDVYQYCHSYYRRSGEQKPAAHPA